MTMFFLLIILGSTDTRAPAGFAPIAIGLALTLIHLISIPVTNHRSTLPEAQVSRSTLGAGRLRNYGCSGSLQSLAQCSGPPPIDSSAARKC